MSITEVSVTTITLAAAQRMIDAGIAAAPSSGVAYNLAVVDAGAHLVASVRMDGAALAAVETSQVKARTAVLFGQATADLVPAVQPGAPLFAAGSATRDPLAFIPGGVPVRDQNGLVVGAIGAGGGTPDQDHEIATAALAAF